MADISMCNDFSCPKFDKCYRAQAKPSEYRQSYFMDSPRDVNGCRYFWPLEETNENSSRHRNNYGSQEDTRSSDQGY